MKRKTRPPNSKLKRAGDTDVRVVDSTDLTLEMWRTSPNLAVAGLKLSQDPTFRLMLAVMRNESPINLKLPKLGTQPTDRIAHASEIEGYQLAINNLESFGKPHEPPKEPAEATFGVDDQPET